MERKGPVSLYWLAGLLIVVNISITARISWLGYQRGEPLSVWGLIASVAISMGIVFLFALPDIIERKRLKRDISEIGKSLGKDKESVDRKLEMLRAPAAPRVLKQGLPVKLDLRRKTAGLWLIGGLLSLVGVPVLLAGLKAGKLGVILFGLAPLVLFGLFLTRKLPKQLVADPKGLWIDELYKPWTEITGLREQFGGRGSTFLLHVIWSAKDLPRHNWSPLTAGGLRLDLGGYAGRRRYCEDAFACMAIWHYRAEKAVKDERMRAEAKAKFDRYDALLKTDPKAAEEAMERDFAEMEAETRRLMANLPKR